MKLEQEKLAVATVEEQQTGLWDIAFIWFCANVAVPRLMIGGSLAELGFWKLLFILIVGNIIVFLPLLALGNIGYKVKTPTMAAARMTFGIRGSYLPSIANGIQLLGWAANVSVICGSSINAIIASLTGFDNLTLWIIITAVVQLLITAYGFRSITWLQRLSVPLLAILTLIVAVLIFKRYGFQSIFTYTPVAAIGIMTGLDIVASNAFAWGPMVCDYTRYAKSAGTAGWGTLWGSLAGAASFMFIGAISAVTTGSANPVDFLLAAGLGIPALLIIVLSSVTTNVINLYSASISFVNVFPKVEPWKIIVPAGVVVGGVAIIPNLIGHFIIFLTVVGSIFIPLIAIMLVDFFLVKKQNVSAEEMLKENASSIYWYSGGFRWSAIVVWLIGVALYNLLAYLWPALGACVPTFIVIGLLWYFIGKASERGGASNE
ncbi:MAG: cytosine permease [Firmicutes bacterium]|nr:cytosine permease [Bacillota bacterium]NBI61680.1 cytosine permease [Clostridiales bacterium]